MFLLKREAKDTCTRGTFKLIRRQQTGNFMAKKGKDQQANNYGTKT